ncbi:hypothetical protein AMIS_41540 [Actinoplanes missouriensis 431]|uniref:Lipoprotein n=1 Tax=Actinoplanes missouriensis (strain ATCC 14538 / DSM 43046 / CBS 188.64 / JCM 3121 / NBRC 102363 / NCIMB 12654 / NRRL B-3342 / UNCC 431) TaxID=512565 RepID=I0H8N7_ACTM4|nr:DUF3500 domain-containing protein [Actinoplanes missouriensis]BAL89374.1 hypothetical protein AMIS_41540 [Actinoplanes missouriensis 431]
MRRSLILTLLTALAAGCSSTGDTTPTPATPIARSSAPTPAPTLDNAGTGPGGANTTAVAAAVTAFLATLGVTQRAAIVHDLHDEGRRVWSDHPAGEAPRPGIAFTDLSGAQRACVMVVLAEALSDAGYAKTLTALTDASVAVYGTPSPHDPFAVQVGGAHLARNLTYHGDQVSMTPSLTGNDRGTATKAQAVLAALTDQEKTAAQLTAGVPDDLVMGPGQDSAGFPQPEGLLVAELGDTARTAVTALISSWTGDLDETAGRKLLAAYQAEYDRTRLSWTGTYLRVDGPHVWIETRNDLTLFRDKTNDYGSS